MKHFLTLALAASLWAPAQLAFAHASPVEYEPQASSVVQDAPSQVRIRFSERVDASASSITIFGPQGTRLMTENLAVDGADPRLFRTQFAASGTGTYTVSWQVLSADDGHFTKGAFAFAVGSASGNIGLNQFQVEHKTALPEAVMVWLEVLGISLLLGIAGWGLLLRRISWALFALAIACILTGDAAYLLYKTWDLQAGTGAGFESAFASFMSSIAGRSVVYRMLLAMAALAVVMLRKRRGESRNARSVLLLAIAMILLRVQVSHAAASQFLPSVSVLVNILHLAAKGVWIGGCIVLAAFVLPSLAKAKKPLEAARAASNFSIAAAASLLVGGLTGCFVVWLHLKTPENLFTTQWGHLFIQLLLTSLILLGLRLYHQLTLDPALARIAQGEKKPADRHRAAYAQITFLAEAGAGIAVLFLSSSMMITTPPDYMGASFVQVRQSQETSVSLRTGKQEEDMLSLRIPSETAIKDVVVTLTNAESGIGPLVTQVTRRSDETFVFPKSELAAPGTWQIDVSASRENAYDAAATFTVKSPEDLAPATRSLNGFTLLCLAAALGILLLSAWLLGHAWTARGGLPSAHRSAAFAFVLTPSRLGAFLFLNLVGLAVIARYFSPSLWSGFRYECERLQAGVWHQSVPVREGRATSDASFLGCMTGMGQGQFHLVDRGEYDAFLQRTFVKAELEAPENIEPGENVNLRVTLKDLEGNAPEDLVAEHDRYLHVIVISEDLQDFAHVHPENGGPITPEMLEQGVFDVPYAFPREGRYMVSVGYTVRGQGFAQEFYVNVGDGSQETRTEDFATRKHFRGYDVALTMPSELKADNSHRFEYEITKDGQPVTTLQPYLAAPMHVAFVRSDLRMFTHTHGYLPENWFGRLVNTGKGVTRLLHAYLPDAFGPRIDTSLRFPTPGTYAVYGEFRHDGSVIATMFQVRVR